MDPVILLKDFMDIYHEFRNADFTPSDKQIIEIMKVSAIEDLAQAIITAAQIINKED